MKPLLHLQIPRMITSAGEFSAEQFMQLVGLVRDRLLRDYEVIIVPEDSTVGVDVKGAIKVVITEHTNINQLLQEIKGMSNLIQKEESAYAAS